MIAALSGLSTVGIEGKGEGGGLARGLLYRNGEGREVRHTTGSELVREAASEPLRQALGGGIVDG
ncbi:MAG: hypothetical protein V3W06_07790 [Acidimicrobiia bacterium]